jgi:hypothetical protein
VCKAASTRKVAGGLKDEELVHILEDLPSDLSEFESDSANEAVCGLSAAVSSDSECEKN